MDIMRRDYTARVDNGDSEDYRRRPRVMHLYCGNSCRPTLSFSDSQHVGQGVLMWTFDSSIKIQHQFLWGIINNDELIQEELFFFCN